MAVLDPIRRQLDQKQVEIGRRIERRGTREIKTAAPVKSGETRAKSQIRVKSITPAHVRWEAIADTPQANYTNDGTRPHVIRPRTAKALSFFWPKLGKRVFFAKVNHPGFQGTGWFDKTIEQFPNWLEQEYPR